MRLEHYQLASIVALLITCGERLEIAENPNWHAVASAASQLEQLHAGKSVDLDVVSSELKTAYEQVSAVDSKIALKISIALAVVNALRVGFLKLDVMPAPVWIGIDMARGNDKTGRATFHA